MSYVKEGDSVKTCTRCRETKPLSGFYKNVRDASGYHTHCKSCQDERMRQWRMENRERWNGYQRNRTAAEREHINARRRERYEERMATDTDFREREHRRWADRRLEVTS